MPDPPRRPPSGCGRARYARGVPRAAPGPRPGAGRRSPWSAGSCRRGGAGFELALSWFLPMRRGLRDARPRCLWAAYRLPALYSGFSPLALRRQGFMDRVLSIPLGVVIAHERIDHPWQEYAWRPVSVFLNAPEIGDWRELRRDATATHYHAATLPLELHPKETIGYVANLDAG